MHNVYPVDCTLHVFLTRPQHTPHGLPATACAINSPFEGDRRQTYDCRGCMTWPDVCTCVSSDTCQGHVTQGALTLRRSRCPASRRAACGVTLGRARGAVVRGSAASRSAGVLRTGNERQGAGKGLSLSTPRSAPRHSLSAQDASSRG